MQREIRPGMKKTTHKLHLSSETLRNLVLAPAQLAEVGGGNDTNRCPTRTTCCPQIVAFGKVTSAACDG
jgi:hypothetical protein